MAFLMMHSFKYIIHPVEAGSGDGSPHIMFNADDWKMISGKAGRIDSTYIHSIFIHAYTICN